MQIKRSLTSFQVFCLVFLLLQVLAGLCFFFANELIGYFATLFISTVFCVVLIFTSNPFVDGPNALSQRLLLANVWIGLLILIAAPIQVRGLRRYTEREGWLLLFGIGCLLVSWIIIYLRAKPVEDKPPSLFIPYESQKLVLIFVYLAVISVMLHYNISFEATTYGQAAKIDFENNFLTHLSTMAFCLVVIVTSLLWQRARTRGKSEFDESDKRPKVFQNSSSRLLIILGVLIISCVGFAVFLKFTGWRPRGLRSPAAPLNILYLALPLGAALLSKDRFHQSGRVLLLSFGTGVLALLGAFYVDNGVGMVTLYIFVLLTGCLFFTHRLHNDGKTSDTRSGASRIFALKIANKTGLLPLLSTASLILLPLIVFALLHFNLGGKTIHQRGIIMSYPAQTKEKESEFVTQMFATQVLMRDAVRFGGVMGDGFWHNPFALPQLNSDMILGTTFFYFGLFGYFILLLIAALIAQIGRMLTRKKIDSDNYRALRFINFGFGALLVMAIPALWLLGAMSLKLPLTGVVFPFLARGAYFQSCLGILLAFIVFFDRRSSDLKSKPGTSAAMRQRLAARIKTWRTEPSVLIRMVRWTYFCLGVLALYYGVSFAALVHFPVLAGQEGDKKYIVIPDNDNRELALDLRFPEAQNSNAGEYRIGNTIVRTEIPTISEGGYSDPFVYISGYSFNRDEAYQGITIGKSGQFSPVLWLPFQNYAHKLNDIILFWEDKLKEQAHLTLKPEKEMLKLTLSAAPPGDNNATAKVYLLQNEQWNSLEKDELLKSGSMIKVGSTVMQVSLKNEPTQFLTITLEPERPARASFLHSKQGEDFVLSRTRINVLGGLQLAVKDIESARLSTSAWASSFQNQFEERATILDRSGTDLIRTDPKLNGAWYGDPNLFFTIGTQYIHAGLDYTFDPILSGELGTEELRSVLSTTIRSIHKEKIKGQEVALSYDLDIQRSVTQTLDSLLKGSGVQSASAIILNGSNEILATAQYSNQEKEKFRFQRGPDGYFLPFNNDFSLVWEKINDRPLDPVLYANPLLRRPLCDAFKTDLVGSAIKGIIYTAALSDDAHKQHSHFHLGESLETSYILGIEGDDTNTRVEDDELLFSETQKLISFGKYKFAPVNNYRQSVISTNLYDAFRQSSNTASCYLALRLSRANRLEFAFRRFMFENNLLLRSSVFENRLNPSRYLKAEVSRYADNFNWSNTSDVLRIGIGDKIYLSLLHLATFYSTVLINDGNFIHPTIVQRIGEKSIPKEHYYMLDQADKESVVPKIKTLARSVLLKGTGKSFSEKLPRSGVEFIGGKTGTASPSDKDNREHKIFVACIKVNGLPFTIACRVNYAPPGTNLAVDLAAQIVQNALLISNSSN